MANWMIKIIFMEIRPPSGMNFYLFKKHQPASDERSKIFAYNIVQILYRPYETTYAKIDNKMKS